MHESLNKVQGMADDGNPVGVPCGEGYSKIEL